jgi:S-adenosylmethionine hydrolase
VNLYLLGDYGSGDLAWAEVEAALRREMPAISALIRVELPAFDTWGCSLALLQVARSAGSRDIVFHNVAPRRDDKEARVANAGEPLLAGHMPSGTLLVGPGSGFSWSMVWRELDALRLVRCSAAGSQFRSRDVFPEAIGKLYRNQRDIWGEIASEPPEIPDNRVLLVDGYGNIKTSLRPEAKTGERVLVSTKNQSLEATVANEAFAVSEGEAALARGSSSGTWEVFLRGGSASEALGGVRGGDVLEINSR